MNTQHTPEPWRAIGDTIHTEEGQQLADASMSVRAEANARRIVACVNYLAGISTEEIERRIANKRSQEPYGRKSLRFIREFVRRGACLKHGRLQMPNGTIHKPDVQDGRDRVNIGLDGKSCTVQVARVICFITNGEPPSEDCLADHIDGNPLNDDPINIRWATRSENGRNTKQARNALAKL